MIYPKSTSQLCDSYRSVTLYLQLSIKEQPQIHWMEKILSLSQKNNPEAKCLHGWLVQWLSIPFWAPVLHLSALPHFSYTSLLRHNQASLASKATFNARFHINLRIPWIFEEPFPKITWLVSPLYMHLELGPKTTPLLVMRKWLSSLVETDQDLPPFHGHPNSASKQ